ncbi:MAG TPA: hypothetical protein DCE11_09455 [Ruminiclostridium sp.]|jgi:hypothetical protein|nr:hypothetical protein [Ruminiclostridium sp.]
MLIRAVICREIIISIKNFVFFGTLSSVTLWVLKAAVFTQPPVYYKKNKRKFLSAGKEKTQP